MGTVASLSIRGEAPEQYSPNAQAALEELSRLEDIFTLYRPSPLLEWQADTAARPDLEQRFPELSEVRELCARAEEETEGFFTSTLPNTRGQLSYDPTGLVKGWAVDRATDLHLAQLPGHGYSLGVGGDIRLGSSSGLPPWRVGVGDPENSRRTVATLTLREGAVATSGTGERGQHLYTPGVEHRRSGGSVTVVGSNLLWADVWATALYVGPAELEHRFVERSGWRVLRF